MVGGSSRAAGGRSLSGTSLRPQASGACVPRSSISTSSAKDCVHGSIRARVYYVIMSSHEMHRGQERQLHVCVAGCRLVSKCGAERCECTLSFQ